VARPVLPARGRGPTNIPQKVPTNLPKHVLEVATELATKVAAEALPLSPLRRYAVRTLVRVLAALALAVGLTNGTSVRAAPATGTSIDRATENPFDDRAAASDADAADGAEDADAEPGEDSEEPENALHGLTCLEGDATGGRRKGVQKRDFLKRHRVELSGVGGFYASDALSSTYSYGGALAFYPSEDFGFEVLVTRSPVAFRLEEPFNAFDREQHFAAGHAFQGIFSLLWSPIHAKFKFTEETIIHGDLFAVVGAGRTFHESVLGLTWEAGVGLKLYLARHLAFRLDVRDFLLPQEVLGRGRITNNVTILGGLSAWFG
jgi:outer membrane beta-barrel protein